MKRHRWVDPTDRPQNRFRRLCGLCGLTMREAADFLEITEKSVMHRMAGTLGITQEEERKLVDLWRTIRSKSPPYPDTPPAAVRQWIAYHEAASLLIGDDVDPETVSMKTWRDGWSEAADAELRADETPAKPLPLHRSKPSSST